MFCSISFSSKKSLNGDIVFVVDAMRFCHEKSLKADVPEKSSIPVVVRARCPQLTVGHT